MRFTDTAATDASINPRRSFMKRCMSCIAVIALPVSALTITSTAEARLRIPIKYRPPRLPVRAPRIRSLPRGGGRGVSRLPPSAESLFQSRIQSARRALTVTDGTARAQLRNALSLSGNRLKLGRDWNAHHVVYWEFRQHPTLIKAAKGGFNISGIENGIRIPQKLHKNIHSSMNNSENRKAISKLLDDLQFKRPNYTPQQTATVLSNHARMWKYDTIKTDPLMKQFNSEVVRSGPVTPIPVKLTLKN